MRFELTGPNARGLPEWWGPDTWPEPHTLEVPAFEKRRIEEALPGYFDRNKILDVRTRRDRGSRFVAITTYRDEHVVIGRLFEIDENDQLSYW